MHTIFSCFTAVSCQLIYLRVTLLTWNIFLPLTNITMNNKNNLPYTKNVTAMVSRLARLFSLLLITMNISDMVPKSYKNVQILCITIFSSPMLFQLTLLHISFICMYTTSHLLITTFLLQSFPFPSPQTFNPFVRWATHETRRRCPSSVAVFTRLLFHGTVNCRIIVSLTIVVSSTSLPTNDPTGDPSATVSIKPLVTLTCPCTS